MRRLAILVLVWMWLAGAALRAQPLVVATYNVENYTTADRLAEGVYRKAYPKPEADKAALRAVIRQLDADVLALQEIGGEAHLIELQRDLKRSGMDYPHRVVLQAEDPDRMVAVLSRRPFAAVTKHTDLGFKYLDETMRVKRGLLEVRFASEAGEVALFVVHLKSRYTERDDDPQSATRRAGEATAIRNRVLEVFPAPAEAAFLIVGDFNDGRRARPVAAMETRGKTKITDWVSAADDRGHVWTHFFRREGTYSSVDHVLVSPGLRPRVRSGAARIHESAEVGQASDHRPVVVVID